MKELIDKSIIKPSLKYALLLYIFFSFQILNINAQTNQQQTTTNIGACGDTIPNITYSGAIDSCIGETFPFDTPIYGSLANNVYIIEYGNGLPVEVSIDGSFDAEYQGLGVGDIVCVQAFTFDLDSINAVLDLAAAICPFITSYSCIGINNLTAGTNDGNPGINNFEEVILFAEVLNGSPITTINALVNAINDINSSLYGFSTTICYATSNTICIPVTEYNCNICPQMLNLSGLILTGTFIADDIITCDGSINNNSNGPVVFEAGANSGGLEYIELLIDFEAEGTFNFTAINIECDTTD